MQPGGLASFVPVASERREMENIKEKWDYERRKCNVCGETWIDTGSIACPFCSSLDTEPVGEDQCNSEPSSTS